MESNRPLEQGVAYIFSSAFSFKEVLALQKYKDWRNQWKIEVYEPTGQEQFVGVLMVDNILRNVWHLGHFFIAQTR